MPEISARKPSAFDAFIHLVAYVALVWSAVSVGGIIFQFINRFVPALEPGAYVYATDAVSTGALRFHIATLLLTGPLLLCMTAYLHRLFKQGALVTDSGVRRWLTYLLLFAAAVNIVGSVIALVYQFLGGNYTVNFLLKAATILVIAGGIFGFYFWELKRGTYQTRHPGALPLVAGLGVLFVGLLIGGLLLIGSPRLARMREYDRMRVDRAVQLNYQLGDEYRRTGALPATLSNFDPAFTEDPEHGAPFVYRKAADDRYELCVTFAAPVPEPVVPKGVPPSRVPKPYGGSAGVEQAWYGHGEGEVCNTFTVKRQTADDQFIETQVEKPAPNTER